MEDRITIDKMECILRKHLITVKSSYQIGYDDAEKFCKKLKAATGNRYKRSAKSWTKELIAHNMLFRAGLFEDHVADTDFEEKEKWHRLFSYELLYIFFKIAKHVERHKDDPVD